MKLTDQLHCPRCTGYLAGVSVESLRCASCEWVIPIVDGVADFAGQSMLPDSGLDRYRGDPRPPEAGRTSLFTRIQAVAKDRWPNSLGDTIELGCGYGETTHAIVASQPFRSLLVLDTDIEMLQACRSRITSPGVSFEGPITYATLDGTQDAFRDAVADTVIGTALLPGISNVREFLALVYRMLKPNGRAAFVVPNRRYYEAMSLAMAEALVLRYTHDGAWPDAHHVALEFLAHTRRLSVHRGDQGFLSNLDVKHLFDSGGLEDLGAEVGFTTSAMIPIDLDPAGAATMSRICRDAGAPAQFTETFATLAAAVGQPFFNLLNRQDLSASMLLWLTKSSGPSVRIFTAHPSPPQPVKADAAEVALGGVALRWSIELLARDTPDGIVVLMGGWCLCNTDVRWVRLTLDDVVCHAPVWRPRTDVHEVLNRNRVYHPLNTLCSGIACEMQFDGVHAAGKPYPFRLDIVLASGLIVSRPIPDLLVMNELSVIAH